MKKISGIITIAVTFAVVILATVLYVRYSDRMAAELQATWKEMMKETIETEPLYDIETTEGTIRIKLYKNTPEHHKNFKRLVEEHFYDSVLFHRVIDGFMIQTGDPYTKDTSKVELFGQGGPGYTLPAEFVKEYTHKKGALAAARRGDRANPKKSSSGSQFYIVQNADNCSHLDGEYTVFGETVEGFDVIDRIASMPTDPYDRPVYDVMIVTIRPVVDENETQEAADTVRTENADTVRTVNADTAGTAGDAGDGKTGILQKAADTTMTRTTIEK